MLKQLRGFKKVIEGNRSPNLALEIKNGFVSCPVTDEQTTLISATNDSLVIDFCNQWRC